MTEGHKHRQVRVKRDGRVLRALQKPLYHTTDLTRVDPSPYPYGPCAVHERCWYLSTLSVLHRWFGLVVWIDTPVDPPEPDPEE